MNNRARQKQENLTKIGDEGEHEEKWTLIKISSVWVLMD